MQFIELANDTSNVGDDIQTACVSRFPPAISGYWQRDRLNDYGGPTAAVIMNGWFSHRPDAWPPSDKLRPLFVGFHMAAKAADNYREHIDYFKKYEPIGCRDRATFERLKSWGVEAYVSYCGTLTLPKRDRRPSLGKVVAVDVENVYVPKSLRRNAVRVSHSIPKIIAHSTRMSFARDLLAFYRDEASLMVTTRLHAALPCAAMGIPVVFLGDSTDGRLGLLAEVGLTINRPLPRRGLGRLFASLADRTEWSPQAVDVELRKVTLSEDIAERVRSVG